MSTKRKLILVTGGAGFIGSHIVEGVLKRGDKVRVLDNFSTGRIENLEDLGDGKFESGGDLEVIRGDIRDLSTVETACSGTDAVLHQAALGSVPRSVEDPATTQTVNVDGTLNIFLAARNHSVKRVVYASSSSVYGDSEKLPKKEGTEGLPLSPYALTKRVNEDYGRLFRNLYGLETIGLRYFNVYGPRQDPASEYAAVIPRFVAALLHGRQPVIYGSGEQSRDFTYVKDVVQANLMALEAPQEACGRAYNIGRGDRITLLELMSILKDLLNSDLEPCHTDRRPGDVMHSSADVALASEILGFKASCDIRTGLAQSIEWYRSHLA